MEKYETLLLGLQLAREEVKILCDSNLIANRSKSNAWPSIRD